MQRKVGSKKKNIKPLSANTAFEIIDHTGRNVLGFSAFEGEKSCLRDDPMEFQLKVLLKKLAKKDPTSKLKALQELSELIPKEDKESINGFFKYWSKVYPKLCVNNSKQVREWTQNTNLVALSCVDFDEMTTAIASILPYMVISLCDTFKSSSLKANEALGLLNKRKGNSSCTLLFQTREKIANDVSALVLQYASKLAGKNLSEEDKFDGLEVLSQSLNSLSVFLSLLCEDDVKNTCSLFCSMMESKVFWSIAAQEDINVKVAFYNFLQTMISTSPELLCAQKKTCFNVIFNALRSQEMRVCSIVWKLAYDLLVINQDVWSHVNFPKQFFPSLQYVLRCGCIYCPDVLIYLPDILCRFPSDEDSTKSFDKVMESLIAGARSLSSTGHMSLFNSLVSAYFMCLTYLLFDKFDKSLSDLQEIFLKHALDLLRDILNNDEWDNCIVPIAEILAKCIANFRTEKREVLSVLSQQLCQSFKDYLEAIENSKTLEKLCTFLLPFIKPYSVSSIGHPFLDVFVSFMLEKFSSLINSGNNVGEAKCLMGFLSKTTLHDEQCHYRAVVTALCQNESLLCYQMYSDVIKPIYSMKDMDSVFQVDTGLVAVHLIAAFEDENAKVKELATLMQVSTSNVLAYNLLKTSSLYPSLLGYCLPQDFVQSQQFVERLQYLFSVQVDRKDVFDLLTKILHVKGAELDVNHWIVIIDSLLESSNFDDEADLNELFDAIRSGIPCTDEILQCIFAHIFIILNTSKMDTAIGLQFFRLWIILLRTCAATAEARFINVLSTYFKYMFENIDSIQMSEKALSVIDMLLRISSVEKVDESNWDIRKIVISPPSTRLRLLIDVLCSETLVYFKNINFECCLTVLSYNTIHTGDSTVDNAEEYLYICEFLLGALELFSESIKSESWEGIDISFMKVLSLLINYAIYLDDLICSDAKLDGSGLNAILRKIPKQYILGIIKTDVSLLRKNWFIILLNRMKDIDNWCIEEMYDLLLSLECYVAASYLMLFMKSSQQIVENILRNIADLLEKDCSLSVYVSIVFSLNKINEIFQFSQHENLVSTSARVFASCLESDCRNNLDWWSHYHLIRFYKLCLCMSAEREAFNFARSAKLLLDYIHTVLEKISLMSWNSFTNCAINTCASEVLSLIMALLQDKELFAFCNESSASMLKVFNLVGMMFLTEADCTHKFSKKCEFAMHSQLCKTVRSMDFSLFTSIPEPNRLLSEDKDCILSKSCQFASNKVFTNLLNKPYCYISTSYEIMEHILDIEARNLPENADENVNLKLPLVFRLLLHSEEFMKSFATLCASIDSNEPHDQLHMGRVVAELLIYKLILSFYRNIPNLYKASLIAHVIDEKLFDAFLFKIITILSAEPLSFTYEDVDMSVPFADTINFKDLSKIAFSLCFESFALVPKLMRDLFANYTKNEKKIIDNFLIKHICPILIRLELANVSNSASEFPNDTLKIHVSPAMKRITATNIFADSEIHIILTFPANYPLQRIDASLGSQTAVKKSESRKWLLILIRNLCDDNCSVYDAILQMKKNIDKKFDGVEECPICYYVIHRTNKQLPKTDCHTCRKKFHTYCLLKWFDSSGKSTCPHCRAEFS